MIGGLLLTFYDRDSYRFFDLLGMSTTGVLIPQQRPMVINGHATGTDSLEVPTINMFGLFFRAMVQGI